MAQVTKKIATRTRSSVEKTKKMGVVPPLSGRYSRSEGAGKGPERHHNGAKRK